MSERELQIENESLRQIIVELKMENDSLRQIIIELRQQIQDYDDRIKRIYELLTHRNK